MPAREIRPRRNIGPFGPIRSDSVDSRINLRLIAHRKDDIEQTQKRSDGHVRRLHGQCCQAFCARQAIA